MIKKENYSSNVSRLPEGAGLLSRNPIEVDPAVLGFVLETANDAVYIFDDSRQIVYVNAKACKLSGCSKQELLQMNISDLDTAYPASAPDMFKRRADLGAHTVFVSVHRNMAGQMIPVEVSLVSSTFSGKILNSAFARDISRRVAIVQQSEHLRFALENAFDAVYLYDRS